MKKTLIFAAVSLLVGTMLSLGLRNAGAQQPTIWLEGEAPSHKSIDIAPSPWARVMSGDKWLQISIDADQVEKRVPESGIELGYDFEVAGTAQYEIWNRIGFEFVRSPFEWRLSGDTNWTTVTPDQITTDLTEIGFWAEVAWLKLGTRELSAGKHTLQIRIPRTYDSSRKIQRILYASDAICISKGRFTPDGRNRPGVAGESSPADQTAASQVFHVAMPESSKRASLSLKGIWQFARWDETLIEDRTGPIHSAPAAADLVWHSMPVPADRNKALPEMTFAHRYFLRTRIDVPERDQIGTRALFLHFPSTNFIATLFINGKQIAWNDTPYAAWDVDVTDSLKPGVNEVWLGIKDTYYALSPGDGKNLRYSMVLPTEFFNSNQGVSMQLDYPVWNHMENGILQEPSLVVAGGAYTSDIFARPSVKHRSLGVEVSVHNAFPGVVNVMVENEIVPLEGGASEKSFTPKSVQIPPHSDVTVRLSEGWENPRLWWPDDPRQYLLITRIRNDGKIIDEKRTKFGFREWEWSGKTFKINGVPWHGRADLAEYGKANSASLATVQKHGQNWQRVWGETNFDGLEMDAALDFFDSHGIPVRRTGIFDGEGANYGLTEHISQNGKEQTVARRALFDNWRRQLVAWAKSQRNHPSIFIWSMENEITFINSNVFGLNSYTDPEMKRAAQELAELDPTRPQMTDGGNALLDESLPIYGGHYLESEFSRYPDEAYTLDEARKSGQPGHQRWPITQTKPIVMGESFFAEGNDAASLATVGGESAFVGKSESYPAMGLIAKMLSEGYRWTEQVSFQFWMGGESDLYYNSWQPVAVLCRQWDWRFASGKKIDRTFGIFNDTRYADPITFTWSLIVNGKPAGSGSSIHTVPGGEADKFNLQIPVPEVAKRAEGTLTLTLLVKGKQVFSDVKPLSVLPPPAKIEIGRPAPNTATVAATKAGPAIALYDPQGEVARFLTSRSIAFRTVSNLAALPQDARLLVVGQDAITPADCGSSRLAAYAAAGHSVVVLEQKNPLRFQALPAGIATSSNSGSIAFCEDLDHPLFAGLKQEDFFVWPGNGGTVYRDAYEKPTDNARSLVQCGNGLQLSAISEMQVGPGMMLVSQLAIEETLKTNPVAEQLLANMLSYGVQYRQSNRRVNFVSSSDSPESIQLTRAVSHIGVTAAPSADVTAAISHHGAIALVAATPANLQQLAAIPDRVAAFNRSGGWIVLCGLTPEGLADYNRLVGFEHMIRPFKREKVTFPAIRSPLLAGLAASNIVMSSGKRIFDWQAGDYPDTNAFSYVVDYEDVAPFGKSTFAAFDNIVNNFVGADGWPLIINFPVPADGKPFDIPITFTKPITFSEFTWIGDTNYWPQTQVNLQFGASDRVEYKTRPDNTPQTFRISPERTSNSVVLQIAKWDELPGKGPLIGIDNIYLKAKRSPDFYSKVKPLLNIGAMMAYPRGSGGIVLCNVKFQESEVVPDNVIKKRNILSVLLRNLKAPFAGVKNVIAGAGLTYTPIDISRQANAYRTEKGWFGDAMHTFADIPAGKHQFAGVTYNIYDFATSPVPTVLMLGGSGVPGNLPNEVKGVPINRKADALFFLQAARIDSRRNQDEIRKGVKYELAAYVVHYSDGSTERVPVYSEIDVEEYRQASPVTIPGAQIAWIKPYTTTNDSAVAYSMQWNNPHPEKEITSIDMVAGKDHRGVPALISLTVATGGG